MNNFFLIKMFLLCVTEFLEVGNCIRSVEITRPIYLLILNCRNDGLLQLCINEIISQISIRSTSKLRFSLWLSIVAVYDETSVDLLGSYCGSFLMHRERAEYKGMFSEYLKAQYRVRVA